MSTYQDLMTQKAALDAQVAAAKKAEISDAVAAARALVKEHGLTSEDVFATVKHMKGKSIAKGTKVAAKYRNVETGDTWTGRGKEPAWIKGLDRTLFLIA